MTELALLIVVVLVGAVVMALVVLTVEDEAL